MGRPNSIALKSAQQPRTSEHVQRLDFPPLHLAVQSGNLPEVEQLVAQGVDLDVPANLPFPERVQPVFNKLTFGTLPHAFPPLFYAICVGRGDIAKLLISKGASLNLSPASTTDFVPYYAGLHAIHIAAAMGDLDLVQHLLNECGSSPKLQDQRGWTPIYYLAASHDRDLANLLRIWDDEDSFGGSKAPRSSIAVGGDDNTRNTRDTTEPPRKKPRAFVGGQNAAAGGQTDNGRRSRTGTTKELRQSKRIARRRATLPVEEFSTAFYGRPGGRRMVASGRKRL
jgi:ankyrin repeat protein